MLTILYHIITCLTLSISLSYNHHFIPSIYNSITQSIHSRISCGLCAHSWFQTPDRLFTLNDGHELIPLPGGDKDRIEGNVKAGREPDFMGNAKFYVGNLDFGVNEEDLRKLFAGAGEVGGVSVVAGPDGRSKGFAFVTMMDEDDTDKCMALDGSELKGRQINVKPPNND